MANPFRSKPRPASWIKVLVLLAVPAAVLLSACAVGVRQPATDITTASATLNGKVLSTTGGPGSWYIEYGPTPARTEKTPARTIDFVVNESERVSEPVDGLDPGTRYHFAVCAEDSDNPGDPFCSPDQTFTTVGEPVSEDFVIGSFWTSADLLFTIDAHSGPSGESPTGDVTVSDGGGEAKATVICLQVAGNRATIGLEFPGFFSFFFVEDNDGSGQDGFGTRQFPLEPPPPPTACATVSPPPLGSISRGDITVHDALPVPTSKGQ